MSKTGYSLGNSTAVPQPLSFLKREYNLITFVTFLPYSFIVPSKHNTSVRGSGAAPLGVATGAGIEVRRACEHGGDVNLNRQP